MAETFIRPSPPEPPKERALVTGASSGIGASLARQLAARGCALVLVARRAERLEALAAELRRAHGVEVRVAPSDLSAPGAAETLHQQLDGLQIDILVNNAGFGIQGQFLEQDLARIDEMVRLNVTSLLHLSWLVGRDMAARGRGRILQVSSSVALIPSPYMSAYVGTKAAVMMFSETLWYELKRRGVQVTTLYPGITTTEFNDVAGSRTPAMVALSILGPDEVAAAGLAGLFAGRRAVVPGLLNRLSTLLSRLLPRGLLIVVAGWLMGRANDHEG